MYFFLSTDQLYTKDNRITEEMSTERELTPGGPTQLHPIPYSDLATSLQLNGGINLIGGKSFGKCVYKYLIYFHFILSFYFDYYYKLTQIIIIMLFGYFTKNNHFIFEKILLNLINILLLKTNSIEIASHIEFSFLVPNRNSLKWWKFIVRSFHVNAHVFHFNIDRFFFRMIFSQYNFFICLKILTSLVWHSHETDRIVLLFC